MKEYVWQLPVYDERVYGEDHHISDNMKAHCFPHRNGSSSLCKRHKGAFNTDIEVISVEVIERNAYGKFRGVCKKCYELLQNEKNN